MNQRHFGGKRREPSSFYYESSIKLEAHGDKAGDYIIISALLAKLKAKMAGYWPSSFFAFLSIERKPVTSMKNAKRNEDNIQAS